MGAGNRHAAAFGHLAQHLVHPVRIHGLGLLARKPQNHRPVGAVALAGEGERAMQRDGEAPGGRERCRGRRVEKAPCGHHRPHRVGARRPDADLEHVEDGEKHGNLSKHGW